MPSPDNARQGHVVLRFVLITLALGVLVASAVMWWWVQEASDAVMGGQAVTADVDSPHG